MFRSLRQLVRALCSKKRPFRKRDKGCGVGIGNQLSPLGAHEDILTNISPDMCFSGGNFAGWQSNARSVLAELLGEIQLESLEKQVEIWESEDKRGKYFKQVLSGAHGGRIPIYRCCLHETDPPRGWIICLQGHTTGMHVSLGIDAHEEYRLETPGDRDLVSWCLEVGYGAYCMEVRSLGARQETVQPRIAPHPCQDAAMRSLLLGRTLMGERLNDIASLADYIHRVENVPHQHIGVLGNSLGGTLAIYSAALLEQVGFAVASSCVSSFRESIFRIYHCTDLYIPGILQRLEFGDIIGLAAPKPVLLVHGVKDEIFPLRGFRAAYQQGKRIYRAATASDRLRVELGMGGHRFYSELSKDTFRHLMSTRG